MKILVVGPSKDENMRFIDKQFSKDLNLLKDYIYTTNDVEVAKQQELVAQTYMILKESDNDSPEWVNYYNKFYKEQNILWVSEF